MLSKSKAEWHRQLLNVQVSESNPRVLAAQQQACWMKQRTASNLIISLRMVSSSLTVVQEERGAGSDLVRCSWTASERSHIRLL